MELRHLRYFVVLADTLHFGRAAQCLHMSQPPLSVAIQQLEASVGTLLLTRSSKSVRLTAAGEALLPLAQRLLAQAQEAKRLAHAVGEGLAGRLRVGFVGGMLFRGLAPALHRLRQTHPQLDASLIEMNTQDQLQALLRDELDLALVHSPAHDPRMQSRSVLSEPFVLCLPEGHALALESEVALGALADEALVLFSASASPEYHAQILSVFAQAGLRPVIRHEVRHWLSVVSMVAQGLGVALVPQSLSQSGLAGVVYRAVLGAGLPSQVHAVWLTGRDSGGQALLAHLAQVAAQSSEAGAEAG